MLQSIKNIFYPLTNKTCVDIVVICLVALMMAISWFNEGLLYGGGEEGLSFYDPSLTLQTISSVWQDYSLGTPSIYQINKIPLYYFASVLTSLNIGGAQIQALIHLILFLTGMFSIYFLLKTTVSKDFNYRYLPLFGALFYFLNPFSMSQVWSRGLYMQFIPFAFFPLTLLLLNLALQRNKILFVFIALIVSFIFSAGYSPAYVLTYWLMVALLFGYYLWNNRKNINILLKITFFGLVFLFGWLALNAWWLTQYFLFSNTLYLSNENITQESVGTLMAVSRYSNLFNVLRLLQDGYFGSSWLYGDFIQLPIFKFASWLIPVFALLSVSQIQKSKWLKLFLIILLFSLFISLGVNFPLGSIFLWLFNHFPSLQLYRNPYEKFGIVLMLAYTPFVTIGFLRFTQFIANNFPKYKLVITAFVLAAVFGVLVWPMWTGIAVRTKDNRNFVAVPSYYTAFRNWLSENNSLNNRILMLPFMPGPGVTMDWEGRIYGGVDPNTNILKYPVLSWAEVFPYANDLLVELYRNIGKTDITPVFGLLRARYMVIRDNMQNIESRDLKQEQFILKSFHTPNKPNAEMPSFCSNTKQLKDSTQTYLTFACDVPESLKDFSKYRYLHLLIKTDKPSTLDVSLRDGNNRRPRWVGHLNKDYRTTTSEWENITLTLDLPIYGEAGFDFSDVKMLEIATHPNPLSATSEIINDIEISNVYLDEGQERKSDYYNFITQFDKLRLYELKTYQEFSEVTILSSLKKVKNVSELSNDLAQMGKIDGTAGFVLSTQNPKFTSADNFSPQGSVRPLSSSEYVVSFPDDNLHYLVLHKTFNPMWKVVPNIKANDLNSDIKSEIELVKRSYLSEDNHFMANGYANLWRVQGKGDIAIIFLPQVIFSILFKVSLISLVPILLFTLLSAVIKK